MGHSGWLTLCEASARSTNLRNVILQERLIPEKTNNFCLLINIITTVNPSDQQAMYLAVVGGH